MRRISATTTRPAVQAGRFYPAAPEALSRIVERYLREARPGGLTPPKAVIAPHAGYLYSGPVAGSAFASWSGLRGRVRRVVLLGPSHWVDFGGIALPEAAAMATPLGAVGIDAEGVSLLGQCRDVRVFDDAHEAEHALEVELPFLQVTLGEFLIVPLVVGRATDALVQEVVERLWGGDETRFVISSDLSHYLGYDDARRLDHVTAGHIEGLSASPLTSSHACGYRPIRGFLRAAGHQRVRCGVVDLRNSGDTAGSRDRVVGYGAFQFGPEPPSSSSTASHPPSKS